MTPFVLLVLAVMMPGASRAVAPLVGVVVGPDGSPVAGAAVVASLESGPAEAPTLLGRATTDEHGAFRLERDDDPTLAGPPTLWAFRAGSVVGRRTIREGEAKGTIRLATGPAGDAVVAVTDPDGGPVVGARVIPRRVAGEPWSIPEAVGDLLAATTDAEGLAALPAFFAEDLTGVEVVAAGFGIQGRRFRVAEGKLPVGTKHVMLRPTGKVSGRLTSEDPAAIAGRVVRVTTADGDRGESIVGEAEATTDAAGRFELAQVASGRIYVRVRPRVGSPDLPGRVGRRNLEAGRGVEVEIPLRRGVRVFGTVREAGGDRPVPGVVLALLPSGQYEPDPVRTDAEGRYEAFVPPGAITHRITRVPAPYIGPPSFVVPRPVEVPAGIAGFELPPITLTRGGEARGTVVDADGQPVAGVKVDATWTFFDGRTRAPRTVSATTDGEGLFAVGPVDPEAELRLYASSGAGTTKTVTVRAHDPGPTRLTLVASNANPLAGRVVDPDGRPIAGASVRTWFLVGSSDASRETVDWIESRTDGEGRFRTPRVPLDGRVYHAVAGAEGYLAGRTGTLRPGRAEEATFPDLVLARASRRVVLEGKAIDRAGRPAAGIAVWTWGEGARYVRATTDPTGGFRLEGVAAGPGFLFASGDGFRFSGLAIEVDPAGGRAADLVLPRNVDPPMPAMAARLADPGRRALARTMIMPLVDSVQSQGDMATRLRVLEVFAGIDPARALAMIEARSIQDARLVDHLRGVAARGLLASDPARATAAIAAIRDPEARVLADLDACANVPQDDMLLRRSWLERARVDAEAIRDPSARVVFLARVAGHWLDQGDELAATRLLRDARPLVDALPAVARGARSRGEYAECLARVAAADALAMIETLIDPIALDRHRIGVARVLAARDPAGAGRIIAAIRDPRSLAADLPALCHAMAATDPGTARAWIGRLGPGADPCLAPFSLGLMALAVAGTDRPASVAWLREAYDLLDAAPVPAPILAAEADATAHDPALVAAGLLAVVERVDPALVPEFFWRSIAIRGPRPPADSGSDAALIPLLARYDRAAALVLFEPLAARVRSGMAGDPCSWVAAAAAIDPDRALALIAALPGAADASPRHPRGEACLALANGLYDPRVAAPDDAGALLRLWAGESRVGD